MLCHALVEWLFCFTNVQVCAFLAALNCIHYITLLVPGCFVLRVDKLPSQCVARFEMHRDVVFVENPPEFLRYSCDIRNDDVVPFLCLFLSVCSGSFGDFGKGPVGVAAGFKRFPDVFLFLGLPHCPGGHVFSPMVQGSDDS